MIDTKSFMEFFEKECDVTFFDAQTGKRALEAINEKATGRNCLTCRWAANGDGQTLHEKDTVCANAESERAADWVSADTMCNLWSKKTKGGQQR